MFGAVHRRTAVFALLSTVVVVASRGSDKRQGQHYLWWPTESAPVDAPVYVVNSDVRLANGDTTYVPDKRVASKGWGTVGSLHIVGEKVKALPTSVSLTWFSYPENRFYAGQFAVPVDRLATLFDRGALMPDGDPRLSYDRVIFGMAPGGNVSI